MKSRSSHGQNWPTGHTKNRNFSSIRTSSGKGSPSSGRGLPSGSPPSPGRWLAPSDLEHISSAFLVNQEGSSTLNSTLLKWVLFLVLSAFLLHRMCGGPLISL